MVELLMDQVIIKPDGVDRAAHILWDLDSLVWGWPQKNSNNVCAQYT